MAVVREPTSGAAPDSVHATHCELAEEEQRIRAELADAEAALDQESWRWVRDLTDAMRDDAVKIQSKLFFLSLLRAANHDATGAVLSAMELWRESLGGIKALASEEREGVQALFLLGVDKQMSQARRP